MKQSESRLLHEIMTAIGMYGAVFRTNSGQFYSKSGQPVSGLPKGFCDCMLIRPGGIVCFVEVKVKKNKPTTEQIAFIEKMRGLGCRAGVAYSVADALRICGIERDSDKRQNMSGVISEIEEYMNERITEYNSCPANRQITGTKN